MSLEDQIKAIAQQAANDRWGHPGGPNGLYGDIDITRLEQIGTNEWRAYYNEPDTLTEEFIDIERRGTILHAENWDDTPFEISIYND